MTGLLVVLVLLVGQLEATKRRSFDGTWAVRTSDGCDKFCADQIAARHGYINYGQVGSLKNTYLFGHRGLGRRIQSRSSYKTRELLRDPLIELALEQTSRKRVKRGFYFNDDLWKSQWYLKNRNEKFVGHDLNVVPVWKKGFTGKGIVVSVMDDGIEWKHDDLIKNYDSKASMDYNDMDSDPLPRYSQSNENIHGTRCAGEIAASANNSKCGVGVAYNARIGGIRMLDGEVTDAIEASSFSFNRDYIDIYSASWGPDDSGKKVDGPAALASQAFREGAVMGRNGLGSIFVWASGNGGSEDSCGCDGYTNSIYTISISSASLTGNVPWYLERCASTLATTYSSGDKPEPKIITTDLHNRCTDRHTGTSASAPLAAGIIALALEANPWLTWRDVQHLLVKTSKSDRLKGEWFTNGAGLKYSHEFGYGLIDASALVEAALNWVTVPQQHICRPPPVKEARLIGGYQAQTVYMNVTGCMDSSDAVLFLEHVHAVITLTFSRRGDLEITLRSPRGTLSKLLSRRRADSSKDGLYEWSFLSTHFWGEDPRGQWGLTVTNVGNYFNQGFLIKWGLALFGTDWSPQQNGAFPYGNRELTHIPGCHKECLVGCTGPSESECTQCRHFISKDGKTCVMQCPPGEFSNTGTKTCSACHSTCRSCYGTLEFQCLSCNSGLVLHQGICSSSCPRGYYPMLKRGIQICDQCAASCEVCVGGPNWCTRCAPSYQLVDNQCSRLCNADQFYNEGSCRTCHRTCLSCIGTGPKNCTRCPFDINDELLERRFYLWEGQCLPNCPNGHFANDMTGRCEPCDTRCQHCTSKERDACLKCQPGFHMVSSSEIHGECRLQCPPGHYSDMITGSCLPCSEQCRSCLADQPSVCLSCFLGRYLSGERCVSPSRCESGSFPDDVTHSCQTCGWMCKNCTSRSLCHHCHGSLVLHHEECLARCPDGTFQRSDRCVPCHNSCGTCHGPESSDCLMCPPSASLHKGACLETCPDNYYALNGSCQYCFPTCLPCQDSIPSYCTECFSSTSIESSRLLCACPFPDAETDCSRCGSSCGPCTPESYGSCLSCSKGWYLDPDTSSCTTECKPGTMALSVGLCKPCDPSCANCHVDESGGEICDSCLGSLVLHRGICLSSCPQGFSADAKRQCHPCSQTNTCQGCPPGLLLIETDEYSAPQCVKECPHDRFHAGVNPVCRRCSRACHECTGPAANQCSSCQPGMVLLQGMCFSACPSGFYVDSSVCASCPSGCQRCMTGLSSREVVCLQCTPPYFFFEGACTLECPAGHYQDFVEGACKLCHPQCANCIGSGSKDCTACHTEFVLKEYECVPCESGKMFDLSTQQCIECSPHCIRCGTTTAVGCLVCQPGYYKSGTTCSRCSSRCASCSSLSDSFCTSCQPPQTLFLGTCLSQCPSGYVPERVEGYLYCISCVVGTYSKSASCVTDCGPDMVAVENSLACTSCPSGYTAVNGTCIPTCSRGQLGSKGSCFSCSVQGCARCHEGQPLNCTQCDSGLLVNEGRCVEVCPSSATPNTEGTACVSNSETSVDPKGRQRRSLNRRGFSSLESVSADITASYLLLALTLVASMTFY